MNVCPPCLTLIGYNVSHHLLYGCVSLRMAAASHLLLGILEELVTSELKKFQWYLTGGVPGFKSIPKGDLDKADRQDTVDVMVQTYQDENAVKITVNILSLMSRYDLVEELNKHSGKTASYIYCQSIIHMV